MPSQKMLERATGSAFIFAAIYLILSFANVLSTLGVSRLLGSQMLTLLIFVFQILAGILFLIAGILFWADSRSSG